MNRLKGMVGYLAGPMDEVDDCGRDWRLEMQHFLWGLGAGVLNPCDKPTDFALEEESTKDLIHDLKRQGKQYLQDSWPRHADVIGDRIHAIMKPIVAIDLRMVDEASFVILYLDKNVHMCGSYNEQTHACLQRKPVLICCKQGKFDVPNWLWGICNHRMFFGNWDDVRTYLKHIDSDIDVEHYNRWRFFDSDRVYGRNRY